MKKKLLVVGSNTIHVYNFIALVEAYFDEVLLVTNKVNHSYNVKSIEIDFTLGPHSWKTVRSIREIIKEYNPSVIHVQQVNTYAFLTTISAKNLSIPIVVTAWGSDVLINPKKSFLLKKMLQYVLNHAYSITADSNHVLNVAQELVRKELVLHNINFGIVIDDCPNRDKKNIIYSNRMHKDLYNIDKIIYAFSKFYKNNSDWKLIVAGSGDSTENLKALTKELSIEKCVEFVGFLDQEENYRYYCESKIYVSVPQSDSVSISLVEAIICGCIPFVSNLDANREIIDNGKNGFIVSDLERIDFLKYLDVDARYLMKSREDLKVAFSKEYNRDLYVKIYEGLIND